MTDTSETSSIDVAIVAARCRATGGDRILLTRRDPNGILPNCWELPGGKLEPGEDPAAAAARELREETGLRVEALEALGTWEAPEARPPVRLHAFLADVEGPDPPALRLDGPVDARWIDPGLLPGWPLPASNAPITEALLDRLGVERPR